MATPTPAHHRLRILFVDDEQHLREFMRTELPRLGHEVTVCPDSKTAVETLKKATFDAAILDLRMEHEKAGLQVLAALKQVSPDTEAVIMTGYGSTETAGSVEIDAKPVAGTGRAVTDVAVSVGQRFESGAHFLGKRVLATVAGTVQPPDLSR